MISAEAVVPDDPCDEQAASKQVLPIAPRIFNIRVNLTHLLQPRNADTAFTSRSAANCGVSAGSGEPGSLITVVNA